MPHEFSLTAPLPVAELGDRERLACLRLIRSENVGPVTFRQLINHFGGAEAALTALPDLARRGGRRSIRICPLGDAERELEAARLIGAVSLFTIEPGYPAPLAAVDHPPPMIYAKGGAGGARQRGATTPPFALLEQPGIAIVGSRNCSSAGHAFARQIASALGEAHFSVISGLARGIDGAAHEAALATGTIAVVAGGVDVVYPPEHADLQRRIGEAGCLVSEMPPGFKPRAKDFPRRNRLISGMSYGVVIVEAARRSGTLITARLAAEQGREVFAVPGHPLDPRAEGTNRLIKSGATMVTDAQDVVDAIRPMLSEPLRQRTAAAARGVRPPPPFTLGSSGDERGIVERALGPAPIHMDDLLRSTGLNAQHIQIALIELSLAGRLEHHGAHLVSLRTARD